MKVRRKAFEILVKAERGEFPYTQHDMLPKQKKHEIEKAL